MCLLPALRSPFSIVPFFPSSSLPPLICLSLPSSLSLFLLFLSLALPTPFHFCYFSISSFPVQLFTFFSLVIVLGIDKEEEDATCEFPIILVGFSKGCVVLNQVIYELYTVSSETEPRLHDFVSRIIAMYWLDGGHSGESNTWITDEKFLYNLAKHVPRIRVHVTPYQIQDSTRPWIGKEQKKFVEKLRLLGANVKVKVHFQDRDPSLAFHFKLLESF